MGYISGRETADRAASSTYGTGLGVLLNTTSVNTKSTYVELFTLTDSVIGYMIVELQPSSVVGAQGLVDIVVGPVALEDVVIVDLGVNSGTGFTTHSVCIPITIPAGATIRARWQRSNVSLNMRVAVKVFSSNGLPIHNRVQTLGAVTASSRGTAVDPGGSINTKGSYSQSVAATTAPINWMLLHIGNQSNITRTDASFVVDLAVGAAASESIIVPNLGFSIDDTADEPGTPYIGPFPIHIPTGSRVAVRAVCTISDASDRLFDVIAYGIT